MNTIFAILCSTLFVLLCSDMSNGQTENEVIQLYFDNLKERNYNPRIAPEGYDGHGSPVKVYVTMYIIDIQKVDDFNMEYRASFYIRQSWNDSRLAFPDMDISTLELDDQKFIWTPDLFFPEEKEGRKHTLITPNTFIRIKPEGEVLFSIRTSVTFSCEMEFSNYPHDTQKCLFSIESYGKTIEKLMIDWDDRQPYKPIEVTKRINVLPFELLEVKGGKEDAKLKFGHYRRLTVTLPLQRKIGFYVTRLYVPFIILVILSWISFWIKPKLAILRLPLLLFILHIMINIASNIGRYIPPAPYTKASDVWIAVCESLVFATFLEFILVSIVSKSEKTFEKKRHSSSNDPEAPIISDCYSKEKSTCSEKMNASAKMVAGRLSSTKKISTLIDTISSILFPVLFVVFNFVYWIVY